jgi:hypothetical protein
LVELSELNATAKTIYAPRRPDCMDLAIHLEVTAAGLNTIAVIPRTVERYGDA